MRRDVWTLAGLWFVGYALWPVRQVRRWRLRRALRRKMRLLGMIPCLAVAWATLEVSRLYAQVQAQPDSLIGTVLSRNVIGNWTSGRLAVYCITWHAESPDRPRLLVIIEAAPADVTVEPICPNPKGGFYPMWVDGPTCPPGRVSPFNEREWIIIRCGADDVSRYFRKEYSGGKSDQ